MITRRTFILTAVAGAVVRPMPVAADVFDQLKAKYPAQVRMLYCLDRHGLRIPGMSHRVSMGWIENSYQVLNRIMMTPDHACTVTAFEIDPILGHGTVDRPYDLTSCCWLELRISLGFGDVR